MNNYVANISMKILSTRSRCTEYLTYMFQATVVFRFSSGTHGLSEILKKTILLHTLEWK